MADKARPNRAGSADLLDGQCNRGYSSPPRAPSTHQPKHIRDSRGSREGFSISQRILRWYPAVGGYNAGNRGRYSSDQVQAVEVGMTRSVIHFGLILGVLGGIATAQDWRTDIGYPALQARLGAGTPSGADISVTQVEGLFQGGYHADPATPEFAGKTFVFECTICNNSISSSHATTVGTYLYGNVSSIAPGITLIGADEVSNWVNTAIENGTAPPAAETRPIENHAWIGSTGDPAGDNDINRRFDLMMHRDAVVASVGVNNGAGSAVPALMSSAYNAISVGRSSGGSSYGPVVANLDGAGRVEPDIVVPVTATSWATGVISGAAALLLQTADDLNILNSLSPTQRRLGKSILVRALIMAGSTREEFTCAGGWRKGFATPSTNGSVPLDYRFGAGELNIDNSHRILTANPQQTPSGSAVRTSTGWNYTSINSGATHQYFFDVPAGSVPREFSVLVVWNRHVSQAGSTLTPTLANIDLRLFNASGFVKGSQVDQSISTIDNVEFIVKKPIPPGRYVFEITSNAAWEYAAAWDLRSALPPDLDFDGDVDGNDVTLLKACTTRSNVPQSNPNCAAADFDGDLDVDPNDFARLQRCYSGSCVMASRSCFP